MSFSLDVEAKKVAEFTVLNRSTVNNIYTKQALKCIEKEMLAVIDSDDELSQQYKLITSILGVGTQTAILHYHSDQRF